VQFELRLLIMTMCTIKNNIFINSRTTAQVQSLNFNQIHRPRSQHSTTAPAVTNVNLEVKNSNDSSIIPELRLFFSFVPCICMEVNYDVKLTPPPIHIHETKEKSFSYSPKCYFILRTISSFFLYNTYR
jgi:hypothetical protein